MGNNDLKTLYMKNLNAVKTALKKSTAQMAQEMNMPVKTLTSYMQGERTASLDMAAYLYETYNVNLAWFVTGRGEMFIADGSRHSLLKSEMRSEMLALLKEKGLI